MAMDDTIRAVLAQHGKLAVDATDAVAVPRDADLYARGLTSTASVNVMLALEDEYEIEFPESAMKKATFASVDAIAAVLGGLVPGAVG